MHPRDILVHCPLNGALDFPKQITAAYFIQEFLLEVYENKNSLYKSSAIFWSE